MSKTGTNVNINYNRYETIQVNGENTLSLQSELLVRHLRQYRTVFVVANLVPFLVA